MTTNLSSSKRFRVNIWSIIIVVVVLGLLGVFLIYRSHAANADVNGDGVVNGADLAIIKANFGGTGKTFAQGDITGDGKVNAIDLSLLALAWGSGSTGSGPCRVGGPTGSMVPCQATGNSDSLPQAVKFDDEFSGTSLDTSKWQPNWLGGSNTAITGPPNGAMIDCEDPAQVSEGNGVLNLTLISHSCPMGGKYVYASGYATTINSYHPQYAYFEARLYLPPGTGACNNWAGFWTNGVQSGGVQWPVFLENDVMECLGGHPTATIHAGPSTNDDAWKHTIGSIGSASGWHIYGSNVQPGPQSLNCSGTTPNPMTITEYYDGARLGSYNVCANNTGQFMNLQNDVGSSGGTPSAPSTVQVDYARSWQ